MEILKPSVTPLVDRITYRELADEIAKACEWLASHGLEYWRTRIGEYNKHLSQLAEAYETDQITDFLKKVDFPVIVNSIFEANDLYWIYKGLQQHAEESLTGKLKDYIKGPASYTEEKVESSSNRARNFAFELGLASRFLAAGFKIDVSKEADLVVSDGGRHIFFECKRPQFDHQVHSRVKGGLNQLKKRYQDANDRGVLALSIGKVVNPKQALLTVNTESELGEALSKAVESFLSSYRNKWWHPDDKRTIGVIVHLGTPAMVRSGSLLTNCNEFGIEYVGPEPSDDKELLVQLTERYKATYASTD